MSGLSKSRAVDPVAHTDGPQSARKVPAVVYLLGLTIFSLTTSEFMVVGMMPSLAAALNVTVGQVGNLISLYALGMAVGGPILTVGVLALKLPNKRALLWLLGLYILGAAGAALSDSYLTMAIARTVMGVAASACVGVALTICADVVAPDLRGRASSFVLGGLMLAPVFGVPATALIEQNFGWRISFWSVTALAMLCTAVVAARAPASRAQNDLSIVDEIKTLASAKLWAAYVTSGLIIGAAFTAFGYFAPIFTEITGFSAASIPVLLSLYGVANVVGNLIIGRFADRHTIRVLAIGLVVLVLGLALLAVAASVPVIAVIAFFTIGLTGVALNPAMVARVMKVARPSPLVNTMHASIITFGLAFGTWLGGVSIDAGLGLTSPLWIGTVMALLGLLSLVFAASKRQRIAGNAALAKACPEQSPTPCG